MIKSQTSILDRSIQITPQVSLSPSSFVLSETILSAEIERRPIFIAPNWREPLPTGSKTPTMMLIVESTATTEATSTVGELSPKTPRKTKESTSTATATPTASITLTPSPQPFLADREKNLNVMQERITESMTSSVTVSPEQTPSPTPSPVPPTSLPTVTITQVLPSPSAVPSPPPAPLAPASSSLPHVPSISELTYKAMFQHIGAQYDIDWRLLASIAYSESSLNPSAVGKDGEQGLMQIWPSTWDEFAPKVGVSDPFDPVSNVKVGAAYLAYVRERLVKKGYSEEYWALVAYNWGPNNLARLLQEDGNWGGIPMIRQDYAYNIIERITNSNYEWLEKKLEEPVY